MILLKSIQDAYEAFKALDERQKGVFLSLIVDEIRAHHVLGEERPLESAKGRGAASAHVLYAIEYILMMEADIAAAVRKVLETLKEAFGYTHLALGLLERGDKLRFLAHVGYEAGSVPTELPLGEGITGMAAKQARTINVPDISQAPEYVMALNGVRSEIAVPVFGEEGQVMGVLNAESLEAARFGEEDQRILTSAANQLSIAVRGALFRTQRDSYYGELQAAYGGALYLLVDFLEKQFPYLAGHSHHVAMVADAVGTRLNMDKPLLGFLHIASELHDIGKVHLPPWLLLKPGIFQVAEREMMQEHASIGGRMAGKIPIYREHIAAWIAHHHERWDGQGYPDRLKQGDIPLASRIIAVADAWDAMVSERPYKRPFSNERSLEELRANRGTQFDPSVVDAFLSLWQNGEFTGHT